MRVKCLEDFCEVKLALCFHKVQHRAKAIGTQVSVRAGLNCTKWPFQKLTRQSVNHTFKLIKTLTPKKGPHQSKGMTLVINPKIPTQSDRISISMTMAIVGFSVRDARDDAAYARDPESNRERERGKDTVGGCRIQGTQAARLSRHVFLSSSCQMESSQNDRPRTPRTL